MKHFFFDQMPLAPSDPIFQLQVDFQNDLREEKMDLSIGLYRNAFLETPILESVKLAEKILLLEETTKTYLPIQGSHNYLQETGRLIFGSPLYEEHAHRIAALQVPGGTAGIRMIAELLKKSPKRGVAIPLPTWPNHLAIFQQCRYPVETFSYYNSTHHTVDMPSMLAGMDALSPGSLFLLHGCCHNPTGMDFSLAEWDCILKKIKEKELLVLVDLAYQGLGKSLNEDTFLIRSLLEEGLEFMVASSYSKNFALYSERVGSLFVITRGEKEARHVLSQLKVQARVLYSNPPRHGAMLVEQILRTPSLKSLWVQEVREMRERIQDMRTLLVEETTKGGRDFSHLLRGHGMFGLTGLNSQEVLKLQQLYGIYMTFDGRINLAGLNSKNIHAMVKALHLL
ncbi:aromatic amino acid transaminase [Rhabdochlamydiaceae symbiont of Dictyostelium giganteum]|uniref:aromatic amino acid transaminase n=1 Tax=Rhabdochlamydiaceae symbiont of Dictyostelium giganteum TaxID=3342349 RepID=UPI00384A8A5D